MIMGYPQVKIVMSLKIHFNGEFYELDEIETVMPDVPKDIVRQVYQAQLAEAPNKTHAVTWTADITGFSKRWLWECVGEES